MYVYAVCVENEEYEWGRAAVKAQCTLFILCSQYMATVGGQGPCTHSYSGTRVDVASIVSLLHHLAHVTFLFTARDGHNSNYMLWLGMSHAPFTQQPIGQNQSRDLAEGGNVSSPCGPRRRRKPDMCAHSKSLQN